MGRSVVVRDPDVGLIWGHDTGHATETYILSQRLRSAGGLVQARFRECDSVVRDHLEAGEHVIAVGRCSDITELGGVDEGGTARSYLMITDRRLRWVPHYNLDHEATLNLADITGYRERTLAHRWAIRLDHHRSHTPACGLGDSCLPTSPRNSAAKAASGTTPVLLPTQNSPSAVETLWRHAHCAISLAPHMGA